MSRMNERMKEMGTKCRQSYLTLDALHTCLPITKWLPAYTLRKFQADLIAGLAVGFMIVPHSIAQGAFSGLPPHYGLYTAFPPLFIYLFLGTSKDLNLGPTLVTALLASRYNNLTDEKIPDVTALLTFFSGLIILAIGIFKFGFVVRCISIPVTSGFISSAAIIIAANQLHDLFGLQKQGKSFFGKLAHFFQNIQHARPGDATMGVLCLILLVCLGVAAKRIQNGKQAIIRWRRITNTIVLSIGIARSALIAILATTVSYLVYIHGHSNTFVLAGKMPAGMPDFKSPLHSIKVQEKSGKNVTYEVTDVLSNFGAGLGVVPLIMFIQAIAVAKAMARKNKYKLDPTQELLAMGIGNIFASFFGAFPITGSFSRSAVNSMSGAATPLSGVVTAIIVLLALEFITPVFYFIPMAGLAAMIIAAVLTMVELKIIRQFWKVNKIDLLPWAVSFFGCFYEFEVGIAGGIAVSILIMLYRDLSPRIIIDERIDKREIVFKLNGGLWFTGVETLSETVLQVVNGSSITTPFTVLIDCESMFEVDYTVACGLNQIVIDHKANNVSVKFINIESDHVKSVLTSAKVIDGDVNIEIPKKSSGEDDVILMTEIH